MTDILGRGADQMTLLCFSALHAYCTHTESEVGLGWDHVARQQYPLLAQWRGSARVFKGSQPFPLWVFRREASSVRLLYNSGTEGVLEEQIRFAQKQLMALRRNHCHTYSFRSV